MVILYLDIMTLKREGLSVESYLHWLKAEPLPPTLRQDYYAIDQPHEHTKQSF